MVLMAVNDLHVKVERAGGRGVLPSHATLQQRNALAIHLATLREAGHSVVADEVLEFGEPSGAIRITHFLSCKRCSEDV